MQNPNEKAISSLKGIHIMCMLVFISTFPVAALTRTNGLFGFKRHCFLTIMMTAIAVEDNEILCVLKGGNVHCMVGELKVNGFIMPHKYTFRMLIALSTTICPMS